MPMTESSDSRVCARCRQTRPIGEFPLRRKTGRRRHTHCRDCKAAYQRQWYERNRARHIENVNQIRRELRNEHRRIIIEAKSQPCADCGLTYPPYVMDFDHVRGEKLWAIGSVKGAVTTAALLAEIAKCDVVCSNCHRVRTHRRRNGEM
jgi:hypothetical protein